MEVLFFSLLPAIIYSFIVYLSTPYRAVVFSTGLSYCSAGFISIVLVAITHTIFPFVTQQHLTPPVGLFLFAFLQVALVEEMSKWASFRLLNTVRKVPDPPVAVLFYSMMTSAGFAVFENYQYASHYGKDIIFYRTFSSVIVHMACGIIMGYLIARGQMNTNLRYKSVFEIFLKKNWKWRRSIYTVLGILAASAAHGIFDYVLMADRRNADYKVLVMVFAALWLSFHLGRRLSYEHIVVEENSEDANV